jgi:hypothetical protein
MSRRFDVVIGNPPYQEEAQGGGTRDTPVYHRFMDAAYEVGEKVVLITPARFLFNAGFTPKAWNTKMLADPHLTVPHYVPNSDDLFPGTTINGGIAVTYRDSGRKGDPIGKFASFPELNTIVQKVVESGITALERVGITSSRSYRYTDKLYEDHPDLLALRPKGNESLVETNSFDQFSRVFHESKPEDGHEYVRVLGLRQRARVYRWIRSDYFDGPESLWKYKVIVPKSRGHLGTLGNEPALVIGEPLIGEIGIGTTYTFITIGAFDDEDAMQACLKYIKTKFARTMLGVLKITQDNKRHTWKYVPLQDFTVSSDIDWTASIPQIDEQLYAKYGLNSEETAFIEAKVKPME